MATASLPTTPATPATPAPPKPQGIPKGTALQVHKHTTPHYDAFVQGFLSHAHLQPTVQLARKLCASWPLPSPSAPKALNIGIMDSSFNPPHYCHGAYLECLGTQQMRSRAGDTQLPEITAYLLLLGARNADKRLADASLEQRMRMVDMLAHTVAVDNAADTWHVWKTREQFHASALQNMAFGMVSSPRFVDKCEAVRRVALAELGGEGAQGVDVRCFFAMGWDTLIRFFDPKYYDDCEAEVARFFSMGGRIAFARRAGYGVAADVDSFFASARVAPFLRFIFELNLPKRVRHISSTDVRLAVRNSTMGVRDIPPRILDFINSSQLYRDKDAKKTRKEMSRQVVSTPQNRKADGSLI
ncbi:hypothetical protein LPJ66_009296 [Kickxella alabastrina]|uniref:Uncharacterized protein n=1 Tax=Kickxella alabastrina TaxID=61397 RepID=A0ACC1I5V6_9FUNG|nr:hypothetical protein LPJ66_009296 [Kickxella alabastrina]